MVISRAKIKDAHEILALQKIAYQSEARLYDNYDIDPLKQTLDDLQAQFKDHVVLKAVSEGRIIGSVRAYEKDGTCFVGRLAVHPDMQNRGIGAALMKSIEGYSQTARFELFTGTKSVKNIHLYEKLGYTTFKKESYGCGGIEILFMEKRPVICVVYFSGTGGTQMIARAFEREFTNTGRDVRVFSLDKKDRIARAAELNAIGNIAGLLVLLYPVYMMDAPTPVYEWLETAPAGFGLRTCVISVSGGGAIWPNNACRFSVIRQLRAKEYDVFYEDMMAMPSNCLVSINDHLAMYLINAIPGKVNKIAENILGCKRRRQVFPFFSWPAIFLRMRHSARSFGKYLRVTDACNSCGWCAQRCSSDNIRMVNDRPVFGDNCSACLRCYYGCPQRALHAGDTGMPVGKEYDLNKLQERMKGVPRKPLPACFQGIMTMGLRWYLSDT